MSHSVLQSLASNADSKTDWEIRITSGSHGDEAAITGAQLYRLAVDTGAFLSGIGVKYGDRVVLILSTGLPLFQGIFGAWAAGGIVSVIAPHINAGRSSLSYERLLEMLKIAQPKVIIASKENCCLLTTAAQKLGAVIIDQEQLGALPRSAKTPHINNHNDAAIIQFTSGSTGLPKAVVIEHGQLVDNARAIAERTGFGHDDCLVSWLPLHHDFGFVVAFCMPMIFASKVVFIPTESFSRSPLIWLKMLSEHRATFSGAPPSAISILCKKIFSQKALNYDLSKLRCLWLGSEPVSPALCDNFEELYSVSGIRKEILSAAYGMAEATLAISVRSHNEKRKTIFLKKSQLTEYGKIIESESKEGETIAFLSNGRPLPGVKISVRDAAGRDQGENMLGEIFVSSTMLTNKYYGLSESPQIEGWFGTGDLGFLNEHGVFVTGRLKEIIIKNGLNVPSHLIEEVIYKNFGSNVTRVIAFPVPNEQTSLDLSVVCVEYRGTPADDIKLKMRSAVFDELDFPIDEILFVERGSIPVTTSGKPQRSLARELFKNLIGSFNSGI